MSAGDRDTLAALLAEHEWHKYGIPSQPPRWYPTCGCGESFRAMRYDQAYEAHRAHLADVLLASGWLAGAKARAWDEGFNDGAHYASADLSNATYRAQPPANPYRTTENTGS